MQCSDFNIQPKTGKGKCADFLSVKLKKQPVKKYCGAERTVLNSINLGSWAKITVKTNSVDSNYPGRPHITGR